MPALQSPETRPLTLSRPRGAQGRWFAAVLFGLQALLWGGGPILEASPAAEALGVTTHVEASGATGCAPIHSHVDCVVCRTLDSGATPTSPPDAPIGDPSCGASDDSRGTIPSMTGRAGPIGSRAPPSRAIPA